MKINNLKIKNYKCLNSCEISDLKRINLFTGRNNTGKSTILEALSLLAVKGDYNWIIKLLESRGEISEYPREVARTQDNISILSSLFTNRNESFDEHNSLNITTDTDEVNIRFVKYFEEPVYEEREGDNPVMIGMKRKVLPDSITADESVSIGIEIKSKSNVQIFEVDERILRRRPHRTTAAVNFHLINSQGNDIMNSAVLWDKITLTEKEEIVIDALKIIEPHINRLSFIGENIYADSRYPIVRLSTTANIYPLKAMGDGINRILNLTLALVNSDGGYLFIDEFENGLHHSVQDKLWEIIFKIAEKLDVQVFATTHSNDSIKSFSKVLESNQQFDGALFRLERKNESVVANNFSKEEIAIAAKQGINLR